MFTLKIFFKGSSFRVLGLFAFAIAFYLVDEILLQIPQLTIIFYTTYMHPFLRIVSHLTTLVSFLLLVMFLYGVFLAPIWLRIIYWIIFSLVVVVQYSYRLILGRYLFAFDLQTGLNSDWETWLDAAKLYLRWQPIIPIALFTAFLLIIFSQKRVVNTPKSIGLFFMILLVLSGMRAIPVNRISISFADFAINYGTPFTQFLSTVPVFLQNTFYKPVRASYSLFSSDGLQLTGANIVLIVDESVRSDYLSVNGYHLSTTPYLDELSQNSSLLYNWGNAVAGATCSELSNALLLTGLPVEQESLDKYHKSVTVFQYAKALGYTTYYFDSQANVFWNGLTDADLVYIDHIYQANSLGSDSTYRDFMAIDIIRDIVKSGQSNFIVFNKYGVHFAYERNYPAEFAVFSPTNILKIDDENNRTLKASYSNALLFNVDGTFRRLFNDSTEFEQMTENTVYIYTSDHGQSLFEDGAGTLHCGPTKSESLVPLIIIGKFEHTIDTGYKASHSNILPTILDLMGILDNVTDVYSAPSLLRATSEINKARFYFEGYTQKIFQYDE